MFSTLLKIVASPLIACEKIVQALDDDAEIESESNEATYEV